MALVQCAASAASTAGVFFGQGPSSKVSTTSPSRRKSWLLKCSKPKPGPPVVSISTVRATPSALGLPGHEAAGAAAACGGGGGGTAGGAGAGAGARGGVACATIAGVFRAGALATVSNALVAAAAGTSVMTGPGARFAAGAATVGADAGTAMDVLCESMTPTTATQMMIASADAIAARRMD